VSVLKKFEEMDVWKKARKLVSNIYLETNKSSFKKDFSLRDQIRRAAISVMANIAEGFDRNSNKVFIQFLFYSRASISEVQSHLYIAKDLNYLDERYFKKLHHDTVEIGKSLNGFIKYLRKGVH
jgi:four helix bundle protein